MIGLPLEVLIEVLIGIAVAEGLAFVYFYFRFFNKQMVHNAIIEQRLKAIDSELNNKKEGDPTIRELIVELKESQQIINKHIESLEKK